METEIGTERPDEADSEMEVENERRHIRHIFNNGDVRMPLNSLGAFRSNFLIHKAVCIR